MPAARLRQIAGGLNNTAGGNYATVPGGQNNIASGAYSFAAGQRAQALNQGAFVWADSQSATFASTANNQFLIRAQGGVGIGTTSPQQSLSLAGGLNIDQNGQNNGAFNNGSASGSCLSFGSGSGEGIASQRNGGSTASGQDGLEFYTDFINRMTILQNGNVGIGTTSPETQLEVNGEFMLVDGYGGEQAYIGGDGSGGDVQVGSLNSSITNVSFWNAGGSGAWMHIGMQLDYHRGRLGPGRAVCDFRPGPRNPARFRRRH